MYVFEDIYICACMDDWLSFHNDVLLDCCASSIQLVDSGHRSVRPQDALLRFTRVCLLIPSRSKMIHFPRTQSHFDPVSFRPCLIALVYVYVFCCGML